MEVYVDLAQMDGVIQGAVSHRTVLGVSKYWKVDSSPDSLIWTVTR